MGVIGDPADLTGQDGHSKEGAAITSWRLFLFALNEGPWLGQVSCEPEITSLENVAAKAQRLRGCVRQSMSM
jgi:hypothetical protein